jgi:hypothetical protein
MTALTRNPKNTNFLQPTKFLLSFDRISDVQYQCQEINLPGITLGTITRPTPFIDMYSPGTKLTYNALDITFYIDEELISWKNLQNWFLSIANPDGFEKRDHSKELRTEGLKHLSDATLTILSNLNNPLVKIQFANCFPVTLGDLRFDTQLSADTIMSASASFRYDYYNILSA